jgi:hypothetical protein
MMHANHPAHLAQAVQQAAHERGLARVHVANHHHVDALLVAASHMSDSAATGLPLPVLIPKQLGWLGFHKTQSATLLSILANPCN